MLVDLAEKKDVFEMFFRPIQQLYDIWNPAGVNQSNQVCCIAGFQFSDVW